jgi:hypothetical protein
MLSLLSELAAMGHVVHFCHIAAHLGDTRAMEEMLGERFEETRAHYRITGQDRSYLAELLLEKGYAVHGIVVYFSIMAILRQRDSESYIAEVAVYAPLKVLLEKRLTMYIQLIGRKRRLAKGADTVSALHNGVNQVLGAMYFGRT